MPARIVDAMCELKERRDAGELVHEILDEVATGYAVPLIELRKRAELSWGTPLETDRQRHSDHFALVANAADIAVQARKLAQAVYNANLSAIKEFDFWQVSWKREIDDVLDRAEIAPELEPIAREHFWLEAERLERSIKLFRANPRSTAC
jgi:hypothetical protein